VASVSGGAVLAVASTRNSGSTPGVDFTVTGDLTNNGAVTDLYADEWTRTGWAFNTAQDATFAAAVDYDAVPEADCFVALAIGQ